MFWDDQVKVLSFHRGEKGEKGYDEDEKKSCQHVMSMNLLKIAYGQHIIIKLTQPVHYHAMKIMKAKFEDDKVENGLNKKKYSVSRGRRMPR